MNTPGMRIGNTHEWDSVAGNSSMKSLMKLPQQERKGLKLVKQIFLIEALN